MMWRNVSLKACPTAAPRKLVRIAVAWWDLKSDGF
jgi:hypothetical protein